MSTFNPKYFDLESMYDNNYTSSMNEYLRYLHEDTHLNTTEKKTRPNPTEFKIHEKQVPNGCKEYIINGVKIFALSKKRAIIKYEKRYGKI